MKSLPLRSTGRVSSGRAAAKRPAASPPMGAGSSPLSRWAVWLALLLLALLVGLLATVQPLLAGGLVALMVLITGLTRVWHRLSEVALGFIGISLVGYAFLGKGYAYVGVPPLFVGEIALVVGLLALWRVGTLGIRYHRGVLALLGVFMVIGLINTVPYVGTYGIDTLRDGVTWAYAAFALVVAGLLLRLGVLERVVEQYARLLPWFLFLAPVSLVMFKILENSIPQWPGSGTPILAPKAGDIGVHLAGIVAFLLLGLHQAFMKPGTYRVRQEWLWWGLLLVGCLSISQSRAALLAVFFGGLFVVLLRPRSGWGRPLYLIAVVLTLLVGFNIRVNLGTDRDISAEALLLNVQSIVGESGSEVREGSRTWRLDWWNDIVNYTVHGPYFWTGKGYGINLATDDGFQVFSDNSLRNPHNGHMTFLARSGVPGFVSWVALQLAFAFYLLRAYALARRNGQPLWANLFLWIFAYWMAFLINAAFDVYLEGPQGGIWFWCVFGFGLAAMETHRRQLAAAPAPLPISVALIPPYPSKEF
ncbi:O-antigen ligase family protein [Deinococcus arenicola]|uniref:O-antigen ligase family protein n=1 Tax=Deinococcus arenicola TaxID=2994950 RepID=A0ABU4DVX8_9DEIO|nr:O-antigen ligase family protein [Deinococcus sp. ZS9-10]MDV6376010.1 O-antigen ligase family protein [Deinococcus sp. ZS9-10]